MAVDDARPVTPTTQSNGYHTPITPKPSSLSLTEYTANPSPPSESTKERNEYVIPEAFLLPNGYPDVMSPLLRSVAIKG